MSQQFTYIDFHLLVTLPMIVFLLFLNRHSLKSDGSTLLKSTSFNAFMALLYTTPWDNYLVYKQVWSYPENRVWFTIGYVPIEEYLFFVLMTIICSLWTFFLYRRIPLKFTFKRNNRVRIISALASLLISGIGGYFLLNEKTLYAGLILAWAFPVVALHFGYCGDWILSNYKVSAFGILAPTVFLSLADAFAISTGIWSISEIYTTGLKIGIVPIEEILFFFVASTLVANGSLSYWYFVSPRLGFFKTATSSQK